MKASAVCLCTLLFLLGCQSSDQGVPCGLDPNALPRLWRPHGERAAQLSQALWTEAESREAQDAAEGGVEELIAYFRGDPKAFEELGSNAVESLLDQSYGAGPKLKGRAEGAARELLLRLIEPLLVRAEASFAADEFSELLTLSNYANALLPRESPRRQQLIARANAASSRCKDLADVLGFDYRKRLQAEVPNEEAYELLLWSVSLCEGLSVGDLRLPPGSEECVARTWNLLRSYPLKPARDYPDRGNDWSFYDTAYLATHIGYVPTGYGRHRLKVADSPKLYSFLRENFYDVLQMGELDLLAEFVDLLRQYGCTESNDLQLRDGTRYLLALYRSAGRRWMAHRESYETAESNPYDLVHKPWTGIAGVRTRRFEPEAPGSYGAAFRNALRRWPPTDQ